MKKTFNVKGMHCKSCEMLIKDALTESKGVRSATADHKAGKVVVEFNEKESSESTLKAIIKKEGYKV